MSIFYQELLDFEYFVMHNTLTKYLRCVMYVYIYMYEGTSTLCNILTYVYLFIYLFVYLFIYLFI